MESYLSDQSTFPVYASVLRALAHELSRDGRHDAALEAACRAADEERRHNEMNLLHMLSCLHDVLAAVGHVEEARLVDDELERRTAAKPSER